MPKPRPTWIHIPLLHRRKASPAGSPGPLANDGARRHAKAAYSLIQINGDGCNETQPGALPPGDAFDDPDTLSWLHVTGLQETEAIATIGERFGISAMILEDILHTGGRCKIEKRESDILIITKLLAVNHADHTVDTQHFALILLPGGIVVSFTETPTAVFDPVIHRIRSGAAGRFRELGGDYLIWALLDAVVDNYLVIADQLDEAAAAMDDRLQADASDVEAGELHALNRDISHLHRAVRPIREISGSLLRGNTPLLTGASHPFFSDLNDHAIQVIEMTDYLREASAAMRDFHISSASNRMNEIMKVLTCFSTIFLPLTFIAGIYGMNFERMPELKSVWGYPAVWIAFVLCSGGMFWLFRKMKWL